MADEKKNITTTSKIYSPGLDASSLWLGHKKYLNSGKTSGFSGICGTLEQQNTVEVG